MFIKFTLTNGTVVTVRESFLMGVHETADGDSQIVYGTAEKGYLVTKKTAQLVSQQLLSPKSAKK